MEFFLKQGAALGDGLFKLLVRLLKLIHILLHLLLFLVDISDFGAEHLRLRAQRVTLHTCPGEHCQFLGGGAQGRLVTLHLLLLVGIVVVHGLQQTVGHEQLLLGLLQFDVLIELQGLFAGVDGVGVYLAEAVDHRQRLIVLPLLVADACFFEHGLGLFLGFILPTGYEQQGGHHVQKQSSNCHISRISVQNYKIIMNYALRIMNYFVSLQQICEKVLMKLYTDEELAEILNQELFHQISEAADRLGVECYVVGGYVRDIFLERPSNDIDVVVVGSGISVAQELKRMLGRKAHLSVFKNFGTAQVKIRRQESGVRRQENTPAADSSLQGNLPTPDSCLLTPQFLEVEFVGARKESYSHDSRKPIVEDGTLEDDQNRRDFTINAMAICLNKDRFGELVDPFNGLADLEDGIIATPLEPDITFSDDPLRMMRCIRFATQLNFQIEDETFVALERMAERIKIVSGERIKDELNKIIMAPHPSIGFEYLQRCGLLQIILPELSALDIVDQKNGRAHKNNFYHTLEVLENVVRSQESVVSSQENTPATDSSLQGDLLTPDSCLPTPDHTLWLRWAAILHDVGKTKSKRWDPAIGWTFHNHNIIGAKMVPVIFRRLMLPLDMKMKYVQKLVDLHMRPIVIADDVVTDSAVRRLLNDAGEDIDDLMTLCEADITSKNEVRKKMFLENFRMVREKLTDLKEKDYVRLLQPVIDGNEIMELFHLKPSREVGVLKQYLKDAVLDNRVENEREPLMQLLMQKAKEMKLI